jgi:hypothetical protein
MEEEEEEEVAAAADSGIRRASLLVATEMLAAVGKMTEVWQLVELCDAVSFFTLSAAAGRCDCLMTSFR